MSGNKRVVPGNATLAIQSTHDLLIPTHLLSFSNAEPLALPGVIFLPVLQVVVQHCLPRRLLHHPGERLPVFLRVLRKVQVFAVPGRFQKIPLDFCVGLCYAVLRCSIRVRGKACTILCKAPRRVRMLHFKFECAPIRKYNSVRMVVSGGIFLYNNCHISGRSVDCNRCGNRKCCKLSALVVVVLKDDIPLPQHFGKHSESCNILRRTQIIHSCVDLLRRKFNYAKIGAVNLIAGSFQLIYSPVITLFLRHFAQILNRNIGNTLHLRQFIFRPCNLLLNAYDFRVIAVPAHELHALPGVIFCHSCRL